MFHPILCKLYVMSFTTAGEEQTAKALGKEKFAIHHLLPICHFAELQLQVMQVMQVIPCSAAWLGNIPRPAAIRRNLPAKSHST